VHRNDKKFRPLQAADLYAGLRRIEAERGPEMTATPRAALDVFTDLQCWQRTYTKGDLIEYYQLVAPVMIPHMRGRPVTMHRFPDGLRGEGFFQKEISDYFPDWIPRATVPKEGGEVTHVLCNDAATLVYVANQACITPHLWLSRVDRPRQPDRLIFDLDPTQDDFNAVREAALAVKSFLEDELGLHPWVMTTGSRGLHLTTLLDRAHDFDVVHLFAHGVVQVLAARRPEEFTVAHRKVKRGPRVFLDALRNTYAATGVAPFAVRAKKGAPVAVTLRWEEIMAPDFHPQKYNIKNVSARLQKAGDPWQGIEEEAQSLTEARERLEGVMAKP
jgi:bifunctional non-homologous end joining protein LigD